MGVICLIDFVDMIDSIAVRRKKTLSLLLF